ncbi:MAG: FkbM family methyltransferase [Desulfobacterales bacterium]
MDPAALYGLLRSAAIYLARPGRRRRLRRFYRALVPPGALCFDLGAHVGGRTQVFLDLGARRVVAVEPQPLCAALLRRRWAGNPRVVILEQAVGARPGRATLHINRRNPTLSALSGPEWRARMAAAARGGERWDRTRDVAVTTLDRLIHDWGEPAFCKIDVEGWEAEVLAGLSRPLPCLSFEFLSFAPGIARACIDRLEALGPYRFNWSRAERLRLEHPGWVEGRRAAAALFAPAGRVVSGDLYARLTPAAAGIPGGPPGKAAAEGAAGSRRSG